MLQRSSHRFPSAARGGALTVALPGRLAREAPAALFVLAVLTWLAFDEGGYFATSWGLVTLLAAWVLLLAVLLRQTLTFGSLDALQVGALFAFAVLSAVSALWATSSSAVGLPSERSVLYLVCVAAVLAAVWALGARSRSAVGPPSEGSVLYLVGVAAVLAVADRPATLVVSVGLAVTLVSRASLLGRLFPGPSGTFAVGAGNRLFRPLGYWNSLGLWAAMGVVLGVVIALRSRSPVLRLAAGASVVIGLATLYFTFSRGGWLALAVGLTAAVSADRDRLAVI